MAELMFGIEAHRGLLVLTGEAGTGKTTLMRHFLQWLNARQFSSAYVFHAHVDPRDLYELILRDFGVPVEASRKSELLSALHRWLLLRQAEGDSPVVVIDEAQALSLRTLNELTSMLNLENSGGKLLQIVLAGQPELDEKLRQPESRALRQRIMVRCRLPLLTVEETGEYIESRLRGAGSSINESSKIFPQQTVDTIYSFARGIPRVVNLLCEQGLVGAYADHHTTVCPQNIRRAAAEFDLVGAPFSPVESHVVLREPVVLTENAPLALHEPSVPAYIADKTATTSLQEPAVTVEHAAAATEIKHPVEILALTGAADAVPEPAENKIEEDIATPTVVFAAAAPVEEQREAVLSEFAVKTEAPPLEAATASLPTQEPLAVEEPKSGEDVGAATAELVAAAALFHEPPALAKNATRPPSTIGASTPKPLVTRAVSQPQSYAWRKHREVSPFQRYWQEVASSFIRDWRQFFRSVVPQTVTIPAFSSFGGESIRQRIMEPLRDWLAKPFSVRPISRKKPHPLSTSDNSRKK